MSFFGKRGARAHMAILIAFALVVSGIIFASPHFAARAADVPDGHTPNSEIVFSNVQLTRQDPTPGKETQPAAGPLAFNQSALFRMDWTVKPGVSGQPTSKVKEGDSFYVQMDPAFDLVQGIPFPLIDSGLRPGEKVQVGTCYPQARKITCIFGGEELKKALAANKTDMAGSLTFAAKVVNEIDPAQTTLNTNGVNTAVPLPEGKVVKRPVGVWKPADFEKATDGIRGGNSQIRWYITFNPETLKKGMKADEVPNTITFTDTVEGSHIHDDKYELYIDKTKQNPDMRQADWVTVATNSPRRDGKKTDAVTYGTFDVTVELSEDKKTATYTITKTAGEWNVDANYKFLYYTFTEGGPAVEDVLYTNSVKVSDGLNTATFNAEASFTASAAATSNMADGYGSFKISKAVAGKTENIQPGTKVRVNVGWQLPNNKTAAEFPEWTAPATNPVQMELTLGESREYPFGGNKAFPVGTVITLTEDPDYVEPKLPAGIKWAEPVFNIRSTKSHHDINFTIAEKTVTRVGMVNTAVEQKSVAVGDYVWFDSNKDGLQTDGEPGIAGAVLTLTDEDGNEVTDVNNNKVAPFTTQADGSYLFENLPILPNGKKYKVSVTLDPALGYAPTKATQNDEENDSSAHTGHALSRVFTKDAEKDLTLDFGFIKPAVSVGDLVWFDTNKDGKQDAGEPGIEGVTMAISRTDGEKVYYVDDLGKADAVPVQSIATKADGSYLFENLPVLPDGVSYQVKVHAPATYTPTVTADQSKAEGLDSTNDSSKDMANSGPLTKNGDKDLTLDFGFVNARVSVGDYVWFDTNKDGKQDDGEPGLAGVELTIYGPDGKKVAVDADGKPYNAVVTTGDNGKYLFENLPVLKADTDRYTVEVTRFPHDLTPTTPHAPGTSVDNDSSRIVATTVKPMKVDGREDLSLDFGFVKATVSVGDRVWFDTNKNGKQDEGERGIEGVELTLTGPDGKAVTDVDGNPVAPVVTDENGMYLFKNLPVLTPGKHYTVTIAYPAQYTPTIAQAEGTTTDNDSSTDSASSADLLKDGDKDLSLDFGVVHSTVTIGDFVWHDTNGNGRQDAGEPGIEGVKLTLTGPKGKPVTDINGMVVGVATTDKDGKYVFENLPVLGKGERYTVTVSGTPAGYIATKANATGDKANDSSTTTVSSTELLKHGDKDLTLDFGFIKAKDSVVGKGKVAKTGADAAMAGGLAALIVLAGAAGLMIRRRMTH